MIGTFSLFIAFLLVLPPPLINGGTLNQPTPPLKVPGGLGRLLGVLGGRGRYRAQPGGGAVQGARHRGHLLQHQAGPLQLPNAAKDVLATLGLPCQLNTTVVRGDQYPGSDGFNYSITNLLTNAPLEIFGENYWLAPDAERGEFVLDLGCEKTVNLVELVNTHSGDHRDRSMKEFKVFLSSDSSYGPWEEVLHQTLEDSRQQADPLPLQTFLFAERTAHFVKFNQISYYGYGGGLQYFSVIQAISGQTTGGGAVRGGGGRAGAPPRHPGRLLQHQEGPLQYRPPVLQHQAGPLQYRPPVLQHQEGPLQLPNAAKDVLATLGNAQRNTTVGGSLHPDCFGYPTKCVHNHLKEDINWEVIYNGCKPDYGYATANGGATCGDCPGFCLLVDVTATIATGVDKGKKCWSFTSTGTAHTNFKVEPSRNHKGYSCEVFEQ